MGLAGLEKARPHHLSNTIQRYVEWYESVIGRPLLTRSLPPEQRVRVPAG